MLYFFYSNEVVSYVTKNRTFDAFTFVEYSEVASSPHIDRLEQSPTSVLDILQVKSNHLHQLVSEGDVNGVRLGYFDMPPLSLSFRCFGNLFHLLKSATH